MNHQRDFQRSNGLDHDMLIPYRGLDFCEEEMAPQIPTFVNAISLNGEYLPFTHCPTDTRKYPDASLRANSSDSRAAIQNLMSLLDTIKLNPESCVKAITYAVEHGAFTLKTEFNPKTKCTNWMHTPSKQTKTKMCHKFACAGECIDQDMRKIFERILPDVYGTTQR